MRDQAHRGDDRLAKVLIDEAGAGELGHKAVAEDLLEAALVVVVAVVVAVVEASVLLAKVVARRCW